MAVRVVHKLQRHTLGVAWRTAPEAHTRGAVRRARAHTPNRSWHSAAPSIPSSHDRGAARIAARHRWHVACSGRSWSRCSRSSAAPTSRSAVPAPTLKSTSTACAHGAPSRAPTQRSTPDAGVNARSQRALYSAGSHAPQTRPRAPCPGAAASAAGEAGTRGAYAHAPALRGAPPRKARERGRDGRSAGGGRVRGSG